MHPRDNLLPALAAEYAKNREVLAVAIGGSKSTGVDDEWSDFDLYVYTQSECGLETRKQLAQTHGVRVDVDNRFWEPGDEWIDESGRHVDVMFRQVAWIEEQLARVLERHEAAVGYSTCFWANVLYAKPLFDREGWFARLQQRAHLPYPEALRAAIVAKNWPILRNTLSSYRHQLARAIDRDDPVSIQHRVTAALASYFDIVFGINRTPHPGEKRLLAIVERRCELRPEGYARDVRTLLRLAAAGAANTLSAYDAVMDGLDDLLRTAGLVGGFRPGNTARSVKLDAFVEHVALWTADIERSRAFYEKYFGAAAGSIYKSARRPFISYFLGFPRGARLELMQSPESPSKGCAHLSMSVGSREQVDRLTAQLGEDGFQVRGAPRLTGDGYYESIVQDPDGNEIEITV